MKRYLVFSFESHYPQGGWNDLLGSIDNLEELPELSEQRYMDEFTHIQVIDTHTGEHVPSELWEFRE